MISNFIFTISLGGYCMLIKFKRIDDLRTDNDLKIRNIAEILGISVDNYFDYANGRSNFPLDKLNKLVNYFKVSFDYITGLSDIKNYYDGNINIKLLRERIKMIRKNNDLSQEEAAHIIGDKQSTYWNYESGRSIIPISKLYLLAKYYNISIDYFVGKTDNKIIQKRRKVNN